MLSLSSCWSDLTGSEWSLDRRCKEIGMKGDLSLARLHRLHTQGSFGKTNTLCVALNPTRSFKRACKLQALPTATRTHFVRYGAGASVRCWSGNTVCTGRIRVIGRFDTSGK